MGKLVYKEQSLSATGKPYTFKLPEVTALAGATSVTFYDDIIRADSYIEPFQEEGSVVNIASHSITNGHCMLNFSKPLAANTKFGLTVNNDIPYSSVYNETSLWTNSNPTTAFSAQAVTLSQSIENFKYVKIRFRNHTANATEGCIIIPVDDFKKSATSCADNRVRIAMDSVVSGATYERLVIYTDNTTINFTTTYRVGATNTSDTPSIPLEILGLNELDTGKRFDETTLWTNNAPTSDFAAQTVLLSDDISNYDYIKINYCYNKNNTNITSNVLCSVSEFVKAVKDGSTNHTIISLTVEGNNNVGYARPVFYVSDTSIAFGLSSTLNGSGTYPAGCMPLSVVGCKFT